MMPHRQTGGEIFELGRSQAVYPVQKRVVRLSERAKLKRR
jgi:hypothetical protein